MKSRHWQLALTRADMNNAATNTHCVTQGNIAQTFHHLADWPSYLMSSDFFPPVLVRRSARLILKGRSDVMGVDDLVAHFEDFCQSNELSLELLREWLNIVPSDAPRTPHFFITSA